MSKALEAFYDLIDVYFKYGMTEKTFSEKKKIVETELKKTFVLSNQLEHERKIRIRQEKKLEALEVIKEKNVCVKDLINAKTLNIYNCKRDWWEMLNQQEFDLLKEVFGK